MKFQGKKEKKKQTKGLGFNYPRKQDFFWIILSWLLWLEVF